MAPPVNGVKQLLQVVHLVATGLDSTVSTDTLRRLFQPLKISVKRETGERALITVLDASQAQAMHHYHSTKDNFLRVGTGICIASLRHHLSDTHAHATRDDGQGL